MGLNRKGFAITAILYGLLILFVMLVASYLLVLSSRKNRLDNIVDNALDGYNNKIDVINESPDITPGGGNVEGPEIIPDGEDSFYYQYTIKIDFVGPDEETVLNDDLLLQEPDAEQYKEFDGRRNYSIKSNDDNVSVNVGNIEPIVSQVSDYGYAYDRTECMNSSNGEQSDSKVSFDEYIYPENNKYVNTYQQGRGVKNLTISNIRKNTYCKVIFLSYCDIFDDECSRG